MSFDKRAYMREYMRKKRAVDPSYGQPSSTNGYEEKYREEYELPQLSWKAIIVIIIGIAIGLLLAWIYFKFFYKESEEEELVI